MDRMDNVQQRRDVHTNFLTTRKGTDSGNVLYLTEKCETGCSRNIRIYNGVYQIYLAQDKIQSSEQYNENLHFTTGVATLGYLPTSVVFSTGDSAA
jgi:hypothetical protein